MPFDRQGYQKSIYSATQLSDNEKQMLVFIATHCAQDLTVKRGDYTAEAVAKRLDWGQQRVRETVNSLKDKKLLTVIVRKGLRFYQLPEETRLIDFA